MSLDDRTYADLLDVRVHEPERVFASYEWRSRRQRLTRDGMLFLVAADHPAGGTTGGTTGGRDDPPATAERRSMLERLLTALQHPRVDGVVAGADVMDDLVLLGALDGKVAIGAMNRGGPAGSGSELDDRFTAYDPGHLAGAGLEGGKMLLRLDDDDPATASTLHACARAVRELHDHRLLALIEPVPSMRDPSGQVVGDARSDRLVQAVAVGAALGGSSARTWLKVPATADVAAVASVTSQPLLLLGGAPGPDPAVTFAAWEEGLDQPTVRGLVAGRTLLYPADDDVEHAVARAADLVESAARDRAGTRTEVPR